LPTTRHTEWTGGYDAEAGKRLWDLPEPRVYSAVEGALGVGENRFTSGRGDDMRDRYGYGPDR